MEEKYVVNVPKEEEEQTVKVGNTILHIGDTIRYKTAIYTIIKIGKERFHREFHVQDERMILVKDVTLESGDKSSTVTVTSYTLELDQRQAEQHQAEQQRQHQAEQQRQRQPLMLNKFVFDEVTEPIRQKETDDPTLYQEDFKFTKGEQLLLQTIMGSYPKKYKNDREIIKQFRDSPTKSEFLEKTFSFGFNKVINAPKLYNDDGTKKNNYMGGAKKKKIKQKEIKQKEIKQKEKKIKQKDLGIIFETSLKII
jgi:hypothetical protein